MIDKKKLYKEIDALGEGLDIEQAKAELNCMTIKNRMKKNKIYSAIDLEFMFIKGCSCTFKQICDIIKRNFE